MSPLSYIVICLYISVIDFIFKIITKENGQQPGQFDNPADFAGKTHRSTLGLSQPSASQQPVLLSENIQLFWSVYFRGQVSQTQE